jgi:hypothetical protein
VRLRPIARLLALTLVLAAAPAQAARAGGEGRRLDAVARRYGIRPISLRTTQDGFLLDLRYRVVDAAKAKALFDPKAKAAVVDRRTGARGGVPEDEKLGALRSSPRGLVPGKQLFILFRNPGRSVRRGDRVDVLLGPCALRDLVVE